MSRAVHDILERIQLLPTAERLELDDELAQQTEAKWQRDAAESRHSARQNGVDQAAIDRAVEKIRYGS